MGSMKNKKSFVPLKNYLILGGIVLATVLLTCYILFQYRAYRAYQLTIPILRSVVPEITEKEVDHYIQETEDIFLYIGKPTDPNCRSLEEQFKKIIEKYSLKDKIVYLNLSDVEDTDLFFKNFNQSYPYSKELLVYPALCQFENGELKMVMQGDADHPLTAFDIERFVDIYNIGEDE